jgi:hypothetical protein
MTLISVKAGRNEPVYFFASGVNPKNSFNLHIQSRRTVMKRTLIYAAVIAALLPGMAALAIAADQDRDQVRDQDRTQTQDKDQTRLRDRDQIYGSQLMTRQERSEYRTRLRAAKTAQEREQIRAEHHERMQERAKERGVTLPDEPPARGRGLGPGGGVGPGNGMGPGGGSRRY